MLSNVLYSGLRKPRCQSERDKEGLSALKPSDDCNCTIIELSDKMPLAGPETGILGAVQSCVLTQ